ncbi:hypothetical protein CHARACLAT_003909 [Characodon lateralis]|uniref:Uncharacterized protein n=1 Tax=Characodon lateralis TaxID=208331 RepID=A0ABU7DXJ9_9TELE|nr:hypothetical protein [Characodon lateralis]
MTVMKSRSSSKETCCPPDEMYKLLTQTDVERCQKSASSPVGNVPGRGHPGQVTSPPPRHTAQTSMYTTTPKAI